MGEEKNYILPKLPYGLSDLMPVLSEKQLRIHYEKHHQSYVRQANNLLAMMEKGKKENVKMNVSAITRDLTFNLAGHLLHSIFWPSLAPEGKGGEKPSGKLAEAIARDFVSLERFKDEFSRTALAIQGSGWVALVYDSQINRLLIAQIEKHEDNLYPSLPILMVLDVWEHAYYLDYQNEKDRFVENWWRIVNWQGISAKFEERQKTG